MLSTRRIAVLQLVGLSVATLNWKEHHSVQASPVTMDLPTSPKEIRATIHGREIRLKFGSLKSQQQAALYCHLWFLHLTYGLIIDQEFVADDNGMTLRFQSGTDLERQYRVTPFLKNIPITEDSQASLVLLASCILAAVTRGDGFTEVPKSTFGEGMFRNWHSGPASATDKDKELNAVCVNVAKRWRRDPTSNIHDQQILELAGQEPFEPTFRYQRVQKVLDWLLSLQPSPKDKISAAALQGFMDFVRWQTSWMEHFSSLNGRLEKASIVAELEVRDRSRWIAFAIAFKCLFGDQRLPSARLAFFADKENPLWVVLGGVNNAFLGFPVTSFGAEKAMASASVPTQTNPKQYIKLQTDVFPQLPQLLDYPLYAIVASLGLSRVSRERKKFLDDTQSVIGTRIEDVVPAGAIVLASRVEASGKEVQVSEPDWHWFKDWKEVRI